MYRNKKNVYVSRKLRFEELMDNRNTSDTNALISI